MTLAAVKDLVAAARRVAARRGELEDALCKATGLSREGVELGWSHLELEPSEQELASLMSAAPPADEVAVLLSANVFVAALRALALAVAAAPRVRVRPSRRDPVLARALVAELASPAVVLDEALEVEAVTRGELHLYGSDATVAAVRAKATVPLRAHGSGFGVAVVRSPADAAAVADDVVAFDQRGCLSPRLVVALGTDAEAMGEALHEALSASPIPRGALRPDEAAESARYEATMAYAGRAFVGRDHVVGVAPEGAPLLLPPPHRHVHVVACPSPAAARALLAPVARSIVAVGGDAEGIAPAHARRSALGQMQRPPLDGPVDRR